MFHSCKDYHGGGYYQSVAFFNILNDKNMKYFEVGMTVWDVRHGKGNVFEIDTNLNPYPVVVLFKGEKQSYTNDGKNLLSDCDYSLFQTEPIITPNVPINEFKQGELVFVCSSNEWFLRYYSHIENGKHYCFKHQKNEGHVISWAYIRKLNDNPLLTT